MLLLLQFYLLVVAVRCIPIDNSAEGEPEIECGPTSITINFNVRNTFEGHVYVKGLFQNDECRFDGSGSYVAGIDLPFDKCNVARTRSLNPRGIFVMTTVVIMFHPLFLTKIDRAYHFECFYMEVEKTVNTAIAVSEITTALQTASVPMPICRYEILDGGVTGAPVKYAYIGQQIYHKWTCDSDTENTFCAVVHSCIVDDGKGDTLEVINEDAGQEAHVYKYADREHVFYQCQISITIKEPNAPCIRPQCADPQGYGAKRVGRAVYRNRLTRAIRSTDLADVVDVRTALSTLDIFTQNNNSLEKEIIRSFSKGTIDGDWEDSVCLSDLSLGIAFFGLLGIVLFTFQILYYHASRLFRDFYVS